MVSVASDRVPVNLSSANGRSTRTANRRGSSFQFVGGIIRARIDWYNGSRSDLVGSGQTGHVSNKIGNDCSSRFHW